jgi:transcriptional regulator with XRE-family HTH domain
MTSLSLNDLPPSQEIQDQIAARITALRKELGLTQEQLAAKIGGTKRGVQELEAGHTIPNGKTLLGFMCFGIQPAWVLAGIPPRELYPINHPRSLINKGALASAIRVVTTTRNDFSPEKKADVAAAIYCELTGDCIDDQEAP